MRQYNKLSIQDTNVLFKTILFHKSFKLDKVSMKSSTDCKNYKNIHYQENNGWIEYLIGSKLEDPYLIRLYNKDLL